MDKRGTLDFAMPEDPSLKAMGEWGMVKANPVAHPLHLHYIRREFGAEKFESYAKA